MKKRKSLVVIMTILLFVAVMASYFAFSGRLTSHLRENATTRLREIVEPNLVSFEMQIGEQVKKVRTFADYLSVAEDLSAADQVALLQAAVRNNGLLRCALAFPDGSFITHDGKNEGNVANDPFFLASMAGEFFITDPQPAVVDPSKTVILFAGPVYREDKVVGSIIYSYLCDDLDQIFNLHFLEGRGQLAVIKADGTLLMGGDGQVPAGENLALALRANCSHEHHTAEDCLRLSGDRGYCVLSPKGTDQLLVNYDRLANNDWYMLSLVPEAAAAGVIHSISRDQGTFTATLLVCAGVYLLVLGLFWFKWVRSNDKLTGTLTIESFKCRARRLLRAGSGNFVLVKLDVKNFKLINRVYNFTEGDRVICNIAKALAGRVSPAGGLLARVATDSFVLLLPYEDRPTLDAQRAAFIADFYAQMGANFTTRVEFPTGQYLITQADLTYPDVAEMLEKANFAHRAAKQGNWGNYIVDYAENLEKEALLEKAIEDKMSNALTNEEFQLYLQPKYRVADETVCGAEALVRWEVNGQFYMHPTAFIPTLERNGFIVKLDMFMFEQSVLRIRALLDDGVVPVPISVNFSRAHLMNDAFVDELCAIVDRYDVPRSYLEIELTESAVFENMARIVELIDQLHQVGFTMSMDDFGSGYSCLALLKELKVDVLKLDKCFFDHCSDPRRARIVVSSIMHMAKELGVVTVAEGVELFEQVEMLRELECDIIQGYYYAKPLPSAQFSVSGQREEAAVT